MLYGHNKTIHGSQYLDVEVDKVGNVVAVWFRCCALPFRVTHVDGHRAQEMSDMTHRVNRSVKLNAVDVDIDRIQEKPNAL